MKAAEWIDRVKQHRGWDSDYKAAKELGLSRATVSKYRTRTPTLDDESAVKVAQALGERPEVVLIDQVAERTKNEAARSALGEALRRLGGMAAGVVFSVGLVSGPSPAEARQATTSASGDGGSVYYVNKHVQSPTLDLDTVSGLSIGFTLTPSPKLS